MIKLWLKANTTLGLVLTPKSSGTFPYLLGSHNIQKLPCSVKLKVFVNFAHSIHFNTSILLG